MILHRLSSEEWDCLGCMLIISMMTVFTVLNIHHLTKLSVKISDLCLLYTSERIIHGFRILSCLSIKADFFQTSQRLSPVWKKSGSMERQLPNTVSQFVIIM